MAARKYTHFKKMIESITIPRQPGAPAPWSKAADLLFQLPGGRDSHVVARLRGRDGVEQVRQRRAAAAAWNGKQPVAANWPGLVSLETAAP